MKMKFAATKTADEQKRTRRVVLDEGRLSDLDDSHIFYKLSVGEVREMFVEKLQREPTDEELRAAVKNVEYGMSEQFPDIIQSAVDVAAANEQGF